MPVAAPCRSWPLWCSRTIYGLKFHTDDVKLISDLFCPGQALPAWDPFLEGPEKFSYSEIKAQTL